MGADSKISWTKHTFNPWWGCFKVSDACRSCYAESFAKRTGHDVWGPNAPHRFFGPKHWLEPVKWNEEAARAGERHRVFCASMADVFEYRDDDVGDQMRNERGRLFELIERTPSLDWLLLTKRPENMLAMVPPAWSSGWPANVWAGTTAERRKELLERWRHLSQVPARGRFLSCEPLLEDLTERLALHSVLRGRCTGCGKLYESHALYGDEPAVESDDGEAERCGDWEPLLHWLITGAESGARPRPMEETWVRKLRDTCAEHGVAFFYKQKLDEKRRKVELPMLDGRRWAELPSEARP